MASNESYIISCSLRVRLCWPHSEADILTPLHAQKHSEHVHVVLHTEPKRDRVITRPCKCASITYILPWYTATVTFYASFFSVFSKRRRTFSGYLQRKSQSTLKPFFCARIEEVLGRKLNSRQVRADDIFYDIIMWVTCWLLVKWG